MNNISFRIRKVGKIMKKYVFGVDIGGTTVKIGLCEVTGQLIDKWEIKTNTVDKGAHVVDEIADSILDTLAIQGISKENGALWLRSLWMSGAVYFCNRCCSPGKKKTGKKQGAQWS